jgi:crotonobetainyl-CoA:carnitine CoA-transferase CaiB-like acyl-CoA transferase
MRQAGARPSARSKTPVARLADVRPLADVRVLAVEQFGAGPWGTLQLADLGAEVIKIEDPSVGGDVARAMPPYIAGSDSVYFESFNRGKKSITLDIKRPDGRAVFEDLVARSDAVFSNLRGDQPARLRLRYADLAAVNPRIVCVSLSGYGMTGPRASEGAYDATIQALTGWMSLTGGPDEPPTKSGLSLADFAGGYVAALAVVAGVWRARRDGVGGDADLSLFETALAQLNYMGAWSATGGWVPSRVPESGHQTLIPFQTFAAADGFITVACAKESLWKRYCAAIDRPDLAADPRFADFGSRDRHRDALLPILREVMAARTVATWSEAFRSGGVPFAPVNDLAAALADQQAVARGAVIGYEHPALGTVRMVGSPFGAEVTGDVAVRGPHLGEHTRELLGELCGYSEDMLDGLAAAGAFGEPPRADMAVEPPR